MAGILLSYWKRPIPTFEDVKDKLKKKVNQDSRNALRDKALISKIKKEYNFKQYSSRLNEILNYIDVSLVEGKWASEKANSLKRNLFILDKNYYTQADFVAFILANQAVVKNNYQSYFNDLYQAFVSKTCLDYELSLIHI